MWPGREFRWTQLYAPSTRGDSPERILEEFPLLDRLSRVTA